jgi:hypothetical protein
MIRPPSRFDVVVAGRRGGKTFGTGIRLIDKATAPRSMVGYMAPTFGMSKRLMWDWLRQNIPREWVRSINRSDLVIELVNESKIMLFGGQAYDGARGLGFDHFEFDEVQDIPREAWSEVIRPALSDRRGSAGFKGTPKGKGNWLFDLWEHAALADDWGRFTFTTIEGGIVHPDEVEAARGSLDERTFRQEYEASFETSGSLVYYAFGDESIIDRAFDPGAPTVMTWDFNFTDVKPMVCQLVQRLPVDHPNVKGGESWVLTREFVFRNSNTEDTCRAVAEFFESVGFTGTLERTGDYSGNRRESSASKSDYAIIDSFFNRYRGWGSMPVTKPTKRIRDRVNALNACFRAADGTRRLFIDRGCRHTIEDLHRTEWKESSQALDADNGQRTDETDALSYFAYNWYPTDRPESRPANFSG